MSEIKAMDEELATETEPVAAAAPLVEEASAARTSREPSTRVMRCECAV